MHREDTEKLWVLRSGEFAAACKVWRVDMCESHLDILCVVCDLCGELQNLAARDGNNTAKA